MSRSAAEAIRQQSEDLRDELKELERWEDAMQARATASPAAAAADSTAAAAAAAAPPIRGTVPSLKEAVRQQQQQQQHAAAQVVDPIQEAKEQGNLLFQRGRLPEAVAAYTVGIDLDPASAATHVLYANRAMCRLKLGEWAAAEVDATTCLRMNAGYAKAHYRRAMARKALGKLREARADLEAVLALAPRDGDALREMEVVTRALQAQRAAAGSSSGVAAASSTAAAAPPALKRRIVIEEVESEDDDAESPATATTTTTSAAAAAAAAEVVEETTTSAEAELRQSRIDADLRTLAAERELREAEARAEAQRAATAQAQRQRRHQRVEEVEEVEERQPVAAAPAPSSPPTTATATATTTATSPTASTRATAGAGAAGRPRARPPITADSLTAPTSFTEFERRFADLSARRAEQPELLPRYIALLNPSTLPRLFGSSMTPEILVGILDAVQSLPAPTALLYVSGLCRVRRVADLALFFTAAEKAVVEVVLQRLRTSAAASPAELAVVERTLQPR
ncbi:TPR-repeat protein [Novymonas esmeraldas]|uniref:RNA polymerase II-associated protein 3 n=1 Tax=Novymonas esmeraldas TaxID=1808958 RepID=A0AAW0EWY5_9TRYP